jgi:hypothetical protein
MLPRIIKGKRVGMAQPQIPACRLGLGIIIITQEGKI